LIEKVKVNWAICRCTRKYKSCRWE